MKIIFRKTNFGEKLSEIEKRIVKKVNSKKKKTFYMAISILCFLQLIPAVVLSIMILLVYEKISLTYQIASLAYIILYFLFILFVNKKFEEETETFICLIASSLYFSWYTKKGNALSNEDFEKLKQDKILYQSIKQHKCRGYCVNTCFNILKLLKRGKIKFVAIMDFGEDATNMYVLHVVYENNGWVYDTYSNQQFLLDDMLMFYQGMIYIDFTYEQIKPYTFDEFMDLQEDATIKWCEVNDVEYFKEVLGEY